MTPARKQALTKRGRYRRRCSSAQTGAKVSKPFRAIKVGKPILKDQERSGLASTASPCATNQAVKKRSHIPISNNRYDSSIQPDGDAFTMCEYCGVTIGRIFLLSGNTSFIYLRCHRMTPQTYSLFPYFSVIMQGTQTRKCIGRRPRPPLTTAKSATSNRASGCGIIHGREETSPPFFALNV